MSIFKFKVTWKLYSMIYAIMHVIYFLNYVMILANI